MKFESIAVTGGNGALGQQVIRNLSRSALVTAIDIVPGPPDVKTRYADMLSLESVREALTGHDAVVHMAALLLPSDPEEKLFQVNVTGTWNVFRAASDLGIGKMVLLSSECGSGIINISRMPLAKPDYLPIDEAHPLRPKDTYGVSKQICESIGQSFARQRAMHVIALRPTLILMPGWDAYVRETRARDDEGLWSYVVDTDVVDAVRLALELDGDGFDAFYLSARNTFALEETLAFMERKFSTPFEVRCPELYREDPHAAIWDLSHSRQVLGFDPKGDWRDFLGRRSASG